MNIVLKQFINSGLCDSLIRVVILTWSWSETSRKDSRRACEHRKLLTTACRTKHLVDVCFKIHFIFLQAAEVDITRREKMSGSR